MAVTILFFYHILPLTDADTATTEGFEWDLCLLHSNESMSRETADGPKRSAFTLKLIHSSRASSWLQHFPSFQDRLRKHNSLKSFKKQKWIRTLTSHLGKTKNEMVVLPEMIALISSLAAPFLFSKIFCNCQKLTGIQQTFSSLVSKDAFVFGAFLPSFKNKQLKMFVLQGRGLVMKRPLAVAWKRTSFRHIRSSPTKICITIIKFWKTFSTKSALTANTVTETVPDYA